MPRGSKAEKEAKRRTVAAGVVAGKSTRTIAREVAATTRHVERLAAEPATRFLIADALKPHHAALVKLGKEAIAAVRGGLKAKLTDPADHMARLRAVGRFADLARMAQGVEDVGEPGSSKQITWEEFQVIWRSRTETKEN